MHLCIEANNHDVQEHLQASNLFQISPDPPFYQRLHLQTDLGCFHCQTELDKESETRKDLSLCRSGLPQSHFVQNKEKISKFIVKVSSDTTVRFPRAKFPYRPRNWSKFSYGSFVSLTLYSVSPTSTVLCFMFSFGEEEPNGKVQAVVVFNHGSLSRTMSAVEKEIKIRNLFRDVDYSEFG